MTHEESVVISGTSEQRSGKMSAVESTPMPGTEPTRLEPGEQLNQYQWLLVHGDKLADLIVKEGGMSGPEATKILEHLQDLDGSGAIRGQARRYLRTLLERRGRGDMMDAE
jgi:hypothetical protein